MNPLLSDLTFAPIKTSVASIMQALEIGSVPSYCPADQSGDWPKNFFDALIKSDWRDWVSAVRKENAGWIDNNATTEVAVNKVVQGASIIPLGEHQETRWYSQVSTIRNGQSTQGRKRLWRYIFNMCFSRWIEMVLFIGMLHRFGNQGVGCYNGILAS
jgi:hypothetical protein